MSDVVTTTDGQAEEQPQPEQPQAEENRPLSAEERESLSQQVNSLLDQAEEIMVRMGTYDQATARAVLYGVRPPLGDQLTGNIADLHRMAKPGPTVVNPNSEDEVREAREAAS